MVISDEPVPTVRPSRWPPLPAKLPSVTVPWAWIGVRRFDSDGTPYRGKLLTDGLERYDEICAELKLLHFGCMQHARAMYFKARKVSQLPSSRTLANAAIEGHIRQIFAVETRIDKLRSEYEDRGESLPLEVIHTLRQNETKPVLEKFKTWVDELALGVAPKSALGKAIAESANLLRAIGVFVARGGQAVDVVDNVAGRLDRRVGGGLVPGL